MADLESVLADVSFLLAVDKSRGEPATTKVAKRIILPDASIHCVMHKYLAMRNETNFRCIFEQKIGARFYLDFCAEVDFTPPLFYNEILEFEVLKNAEERLEKARKIFDTYVMAGLLVREHKYSQHALEVVQGRLQRHEIADCLFEPYKVEIEKVLYSGNNLFENFLMSRFYVRFCQWKNLECSFHPTMQDFVMHRIIGRGGFGEVYGCRKGDTGMMYAMKCLDKKRLKLKNGEKAAMNERNVLAQVNSPFIVCMTYAFQTAEKLCFVLDLMNGGDLHYHLSQYKCFEENQVRFYAQEILLGLEHLHNQKIVYRDLKPANCLLTEEGHLKISDLGLACTVREDEKPKERVGTHGYMAPEVLTKDQCYDCTSDWFSFGCMLYKMLCGHNPFRQHGRGRDKVDVDRETLHSEVTCPVGWSDPVKDLVTRLLVKNPEKRLGCEGPEEVKNHPFFENVDWRDVHALRYDPPFVPPRGEVNAMDSFQIGQFDDEDVKGIRLTEGDQKEWKDFDLVVSSRWQEEICTTSVFDVVNGEYDKTEVKRLSKIRRSATDPSFLYDPSRTLKGDCVLEGYLSKRGFASWERRYFRLYPNRLEWSEDQHLEASNLVTMEMVTAVTKTHQRGAKYCMKLVMKGGRNDCLLKADSKPEMDVWFADLKRTVQDVLCLMQSGPKVLRLGSGNGQGHLVSPSGSSGSSRFARTISEPAGVANAAHSNSRTTTDV